jgi:hypothetical protein
MFLFLPANPEDAYSLVPRNGILRTDRVNRDKD